MGVTLGSDSVVTVGEAVTKFCEPYSVLGGIPANLIKKRFSPEQINERE